jgi:hypoxanthine phosphoribosyltransferase
MNTNNKIVAISDKRFKHYLTHEQIQLSLRNIADKINAEYAGKKPVFLVVLNGAFMFATDLLKMIQIECEVSFIRLASYQGMQTTHVVKEIFGIENELKGKHVIMLEDIIDTGITMEHLLKKISENGAESIKVATLLFKKEKFEKNYHIDYIGFTIPNDFVVGYGLDYNGYGRNLEDIYSVIDE